MLLPSFSWAQDPLKNFDDPPMDQTPGNIPGGMQNGFPPQELGGLQGGYQPQMQNGFPPQVQGGLQGGYQPQMQNGYQDNARSRGSSYGRLRSQGECSFNSNLNQTDQDLLTSAGSTLDNLENSDRCRSVVQETNQAYSRALAAYRTLSGLDRAGGYAGSTPIDCTNYVVQYDNQYERFIADLAIQGPRVQDFANSNEVVNNCQRFIGDNAAATNCALSIASQLKETQRRRCEDLSESQAGRAQAQMQVDAVEAGMAAISSLLNNSECVPRAGSGAAATLGQAGIQLAGQAATMAVGIGSFASTLIGGATSLISTIVGRLFGNNATYAQQLRDYDDLQGLACMYEQVENRNLRCNIRAASEEIDAENGEVERQANIARQCLGQGLNSYQNDISSFLDSLQTVATRLSVQPAVTNSNEEVEAPEPPRPIDFNEYASIMGQLEQNLPGTNTSVLAFATSSAQDVEQKINSALTNPTELAALAQSREVTVDSAIQRRQFSENLRAEVQRIASLREVLSYMTNMNTDEALASADTHLATLNTMITSSGLGNGGVTAAIEDVLRTRQNQTLFPNDSTATRIQNYQALNARSNFYRGQVQNFERLRREANQRIQDDGNFGLAQSGLKEFINRRLNNEFRERADRLDDAFRGLSVGPTTSQETRTNRRILYDRHIGPLIKYCNQLRTVMTGIGAGSRPNGLNSECARFVCENGMQNFPGTTGNSTCSGDCILNYEKFVCQQTLRLEEIENRLTSEFLEQGQVCGRSLVN